MKHYFLDTNVVLNFLARREPFAETALESFRAGLERRAVLYVASLLSSTIYYDMRKQTSRPAALSMVANLAKLVTIVAVDAAAVQQAINGPFPDSKDGIQHYTATPVAAIEALVTRNAVDFTNSLVPALTPPQALHQLSQA